VTDNAIPAARQRFDIIDIARGAALVGMIVYHLFWDLSFLRFFPVDVGYDPAWVAYARLLLASFLLLVGAGLVLAHGNGVRWRPFWRRLGLLVAAALAITVATIIAFPQSFVYFGILHAIALFSLLSLPFLRAPLWLVVAVAAAVTLVPMVYSDPLFDQRLWSWIGLWVVAPPANDLVPLFPWFGIVLVGVVMARLVLASPLAPRLATIKASGRSSRLLATAGRWSLLIYLLHQPILLAILYPLAMWQQPDIAARNQEFLASCQQTCLDGGTPADLCVTYCQCGLAGVQQNDLWNAIYTGQVTAAEQALLDAQNRQCSAVIYPSAPSSP
jgi:uncharacterized membrane protein